MSYAGFGLKVKEPLEKIKELAKRYQDMVAKMPEKALDGYSLELLLRENYDMEYKLLNHDLTKDPLAMVSMISKEDYIEHGDMFNRLRRFRIYKVHEHTGLNQNEFFAQPRHIVEMTFRELGEEMERMARAMNPNKEKDKGFEVVQNIDPKLLAEWRKRQVPTR